MLVEVCANSLESALNAQKAGADRIELCSELAVGGITPSFGLLKSIKEQLSIPVHVLIRPRSGDFTFSREEFNIMRQNIKLCVDLGFNGIVSGVLNDDFTIDVQRTKELKKLSGNLKFTFHRAFDWVSDPFKALDQLEALGANSILTSGQQKSAIKGIELLTDLHEKSSNCVIMPGGGVNAKNVAQFKEYDFKAVHLSGVKFRQTLNSKPLVSMNSSSFLVDEGVYVSNIESIKSVLKEVK